MRMAINYHKESFKPRDIRYRVGMGASSGKSRDKRTAPLRVHETGRGRQWFMSTTGLGVTSPFSAGRRELS